MQGLVRLAEAHAKTRLSPTVDKEDAQVAIRLTKYYMLQVGYDRLMQENKPLRIARRLVQTMHYQDQRAYHTRLEPEKPSGRNVE